jgi:hypothetical protein
VHCFPHALYAELQMTKKPNFRLVRPPKPLSPAIHGDLLVSTDMLLWAIRLIRLGYAHRVIIREVFGDSPEHQAVGRKMLQRLRDLGFSVAAERDGKTLFSLRKASLISQLAGRPDAEIDAAIADLLDADEPQLRRMLTGRRQAAIEPSTRTDHS